MKETKEKKVIKMTKKGLQEQKESLIALTNARVELKKAIAITRKSTIEIDYDENYSLHELEREVDVINSAINDIKKIIESAEIIEVSEMTDDSINIGDKLDVNFIYAPDDEEEMTITLVGGTGSALNNLVSINSPVGSAIYGRKIGETVSYKANNNNAKVKILRKVNNPIK